MNSLARSLKWRKSGPIAFGAVVCVGCIGEEAFSQSARSTAVEETRAPIVQGSRIAEAPAPPREAGAVSDEPLGVDLSGVALVPDQVASTSVSSSIDVSAVNPPDPASLERRLEPFLGRPLSLKLIADLRGAVVEHYRARALPLVSVSAPPQDITDGRLKLRVVVFEVGEVAVEGADYSSEDYIRAQSRLGVGDLVDSDVLVEDVNFLNLNPYRNLSVVFEPGAEPGQTKLRLVAREETPFTVYSGYSNSGSSSAGEDRYFVGARAALAPFLDHQVSYQFTFDPNFVRSRDGGFAGDSRFQSHSGTYFAPLPWRHKATLEGAFTTSRSDLQDPFGQTSDSWRLYAEYAVPVSSVGDFQGDVYFGAEFKRQESQLFFADFAVDDSELETFTIAGGARGTQRDGYGATAFDIGGAYSPGDVSADNSDRDFVEGTGDPGAKPTYFIARGSVTRQTVVKPIHAIWTTQAKAQVASDTLPGLEQFSLGGASTVRGYNPLEVGGDTAVALQNELAFTLGSLVSVIDGEISRSGRFRRSIADAQLFTFFDFGYSNDIFASRETELYSTGVGYEFNFGDAVYAGGSIGWALREGPETNDGDYRGAFNVTVKY